MPVADEVRVWWNRSQLARRLGCDASQLRKLEREEGGIYQSRPSPELGGQTRIYHKEQVRLIDKVRMHGREALPAAQAEWAAKEPLIGEEPAEPKREDARS